MKGSTMENYDPNNRFGTHLVQLTFQQWEYKLTVEVQVGGNCKGMMILEAAVDNFFSGIYKSQGDYPVIIMKDDKGDELESDVVEDEDDLKNMLVEAKILSFTKE